MHPHIIGHRSRIVIGAPAVRSGPIWAAEVP